MNVLVCIIVSYSFALKLFMKNFLPKEKKVVLLQTQISDD